jgi:short-subunit dehydrogenase
MPKSFDDANVVITGASSGIGRAIARQIAPRARRLILVARRTDRLEELRTELVAANDRLTVDLLPCDLCDSAARTRLAQTLVAGPPVDVLVNNAGVGDFALFDLSDPVKVRNLIELNITALVELTGALVGGMVARGSGAVLNISSGFGLAWLPGFGVYAASKHFVTAFTETLRADLHGTGVVASQVCPGPVDTEFTANTGADADTAALMPSWVSISAEHCARAAVAALDHDRAMVLPGFLMKLMALLVALTPRFLMRLILAPAGAWLRAREKAAS